MAKDNSSDQRQEDNSSDQSEKENSSDHESKKENSSDEHEKDNSSDDESEKDNSSDDESEKDNSSDDESEKDNSSDDESEKDNFSDESEKDNSSDDESEEYDPKADTIKKRKAGVIKKEGKKRKISEEDNREETLQILLQRLKKIAEEDDRESSTDPPNRIIDGVVGVTFYGECIYKQLTESDVNGGQCRLMLGKKEVKDKFFSRLAKSEIPGVVEGVDVLVYGRDGKSQEMKFKMWNKNTPVLMNGWSQFVKDYELQKYSDVVKIWMFRASEDRKICFAIDSIRFEGINKRLSKRISKTAFKN